jgi:hypothetical protein
MPASPPAPRPQHLGLGDIRMPTSAAKLDVSGMRPTTPEAAMAALDHVVAWFHSTMDARAVFPDVYSVITGKVIERLGDGSGYFSAPEFISMLVGVFTTRYLQTLDWSLRGLPQDSAGWEIAYRKAAENTLPASTHAALGISAHINYDLALGIHEVVVRLGAAQDPSRLRLFRHDHDAVNALLAASVPESWRRLREVHGCPLLNSAPGTTREWAAPYVLQTLTRWRDDVWGSMLDLLGAASASERAAVLSQMDQRTAIIGVRIAHQRTISAKRIRLLRLARSPIKQ